jgi:hypothetical protein
MTYSTPLLASLAFALVAAGCGVTIAGGGAGGSGGQGTTTGTGTGNSTTVTTTTVSSSSSSTSGATTTSSSSSSSGSDAHAEPPQPGPQNPGDGTGATVFAVTHLYVGDTNRDGTPDPANAWKQYGFDLDGKISDQYSVDLCKPQSNAAPKTVYPDGYAGIDNSFGKNILPILLGLTADFSQKVNDSIAQGQGTLLIDIEQLGAGADYNPLLARLYQSADLGQPPHFDGTDHWPVAPESLVSPTDVTSAKVSMPQSYVFADTWVGSYQGDMHLKLPSAGFMLDITIHHPVIAMKLDPAHKSAVNGTIAGLVPTESFVQMIKQIAGQFDPALCNGPTIDSITTQIRQASDSLADGSQDPTKTCDSISIGIGFDAVVDQLGAVAPPTPPPPNPCAP